MRALWTATLVVLAEVGGCGRTPSSPPVKPIAISAPTDRGKAAASKAACIKPPEESGSILHAGGDDSYVNYCVGTAVDQCFSIELATGTLTSLLEQPKAQLPALVAAARIETTNPELKVCTDATGCKTLTPQVWPGAAPLRAATNGTIAAVMLGDAEKGKGYIDIYDVLKTKKLATVKYGRGEFKCGDLAMLGDTLYVNATECQGTSGRAALYSAKGKKIANVGGRADFGTFGKAYTQVDGTMWAFLEESGNRLALQDVVKGKVVKLIDLTPLFSEAGGAKMGNPGESAIVRLGNGKVAVIAGTPANGSVAIVDLTSGAVKVVRAAMCNGA
jgi:hypothetical protein